jgi:hypothetical protein
LIPVLSFAYGITLAGLPLEVFKDRANYLIYAADSWRILVGYWEQGPLAAMANEPLWLLINAGLATALPAEAVLSLIIFAPATALAWAVLRREPGQIAWLFLFLLSPQVLKNHIIHLSQGMAVATFIAGWYASSRPRRWLLVGATPFIHSSFFFILLLLALTNAMQRLKFSGDIRATLFATAGIGIGLNLGWIASLLGAQQAQWYDFSMGDVSGAGFLFWTMVFVVLCLQGHAFVRRHTFELGVIVFYLATYFFIEVTARIFESGLLAILIAGLHLTGWRRPVFLSLIVSYTTMQYALRIREPWLGFGLV